ncbi:alpha/beta hydrolase [Corticibacterium sp. UT-5YL-CI-8]|nr:alpha/beta hydrolase [Tianweitania sp. UT-5YL-CI-8]
MTNGRYFQSGNARLYFENKGQGEPVILVHGYSTSGAGQWGEGFIDRLAQEFHTIALDNRGHGHSQMLYDRYDYGPEMGRDIIRLMDHLGLAKAHVVAYSLGAHITAQALASAPERFTTLTIGGAAGRWLPFTAEELAAFDEEADELETGSMTKHILKLWTPGAAKPDIEEVKRISEQRLRGKDARALAAVKRSMPDHAVTVDAIAAAKVPMLGLIGTEDLQLEAMRELSRRVPGMRLVEIAGATHGNTPSKPEFGDAILDFLKRHPLQGTAA